MSTPSRNTEPESSVSKPAIRRSSVVLPQPEGPSKVTNSPWEISRSKSASIDCPENAFDKARIDKTEFATATHQHNRLILTWNSSKKMMQKHYPILHTFSSQILTIDLTRQYTSYHLPALPHIRVGCTDVFSFLLQNGLVIRNFLNWCVAMRMGFTTP